MSGSTPPTGYPVVRLLGELRADLREHAARDERRLDALEQGQGSLARETAFQTASLLRIEKALERDDKIAVEEKTQGIKLRSRIKGWVVKTLLGIVALATGAYVHHLWG